MEVAAYISLAMYNFAKDGKKLIKIPYFFDKHYVMFLLNIQLGTAVLFDSLNTGKAQLRPFVTILKNAWKHYCLNLKGPHPDGEVLLKVGYDYPVSKQPLGSLLCGYYACEHLRMTGSYKVDREDFPEYKKERDWVFKKDMETVGTEHIIVDMCLFLRREVFHNQGEFFDPEGTLAEFPHLTSYEKYGL